MVDPADTPLKPPPPSSEESTKTVKVPFPRQSDSSEDPQTTPTTQDDDSQNEKEPSSVKESKGGYGDTPSSRDEEHYVSSLPFLSSVGTTQQTLLHPKIRTLKRILPSVIAIFLCSIFVVVKDIAELSGTKDFAFLILVIYTLYFHCNATTVGKHIQVTGKLLPLKESRSSPSSH